MSSRLYQLFFFLFTSLVLAQNGFQFETKRKKIVIPFKFINNLVIVPVEINGVKLNFLVDTGVSETLLFSLDETEKIKFENLEKVMFSGFGNKEPFEGLKSTDNKVKIKNLVDNNHTIFIVLDQEINISSQVGFPINGIIGSHFFKNFPVEIKYKRNKIIVYDTITNGLKKKKHIQFPISIEGGKPYIFANVSFENNTEDMKAKLLIDTGNSDALWLFQSQNKSIVMPNICFNDFLGKGFSGNIFGKRGRLKSFEIGNFVFKKPLISFPDSTATLGIEMVENRVGSIGSEIMKRFNAIYDYANNSIYLDKNDNFILPFNFNMSGLDVQHEGLQWVKEEYDDNGAISKVTFDNEGSKVVRNLKYRFELKPSYSILSVLKGSPADLAGLKEGDLLKKINGNVAHNLTLQQIKDILKSEDGKIITIEVERKGVIIKTKFQLKSIL